MYTFDDINMFAFGVFDKDDSGTIDEGELLQLLHDVQDDPPDWEKTFKNAVAKIDGEGIGDGLVSFREFTQLVKVGAE